MKSNKILITICILLSLVPIAIFTGCQEEESFNKYENDIYLYLPSGIDFRNLSKSQLEIISRAFFRLDINENKDGLFKIKQTCGSQVNISEELFAYFYSLTENANERILSSGINYSRNRVKTRQEVNNERTDCVALALNYALGGGYTQYNSWITEQYGNNGVPVSSFYDVMSHFNGGGRQISMSGYDTIGLGESNIIIVINQGRHAVNLEFKNGDNILYFDAQNGQYGICSASDVSHAYQLR